MTINQPASKRFRDIAPSRLRVMLASTLLSIVVVAPSVSASDDPFLIDYLSIKSPADNVALRQTLTGAVATHD
ncbi:MAG: hypothetical protein RLN69_10330, partial [Woeseiaceae bacterium]